MGTTNVVVAKTKRSLQRRALFSPFFFAVESWCARPRGVSLIKSVINWVSFADGGLSSLSFRAFYPFFGSPPSRCWWKAVGDTSYLLHPARGGSVPLVAAVVCPSKNNSNFFLSNIINHDLPFQVHINILTREKSICMPDFYETICFTKCVDRLIKRSMRLLERSVTCCFDTVRIFSIIFWLRIRVVNTRTH